MKGKKGKKAAPLPLKKKITLTQRAYEILKRAILIGEIPEGAFISEQEIGVKYEIGHTPFREACNRLYNERMLEVVPHRGYFVPELSFRTVRNIFEARLVIECAIAELAAVRAEDEQIRELERIEENFAAAVNLQEDYPGVIDANTEFHLCLARMTQNDELVQLATRALEHNQRLSYLELRRVGVRQEGTKLLHEPIIDSIRRRDPIAAKAAVLSDIVQAQNLLTGVPLRPPITPSTAAAVK